MNMNIMDNHIECNITIGRRVDTIKVCVFSREEIKRIQDNVSNASNRRKSHNHK